MATSTYKLPREKLVIAHRIAGYLDDSDAACLGQICKILYKVWQAPLHDSDTGSVGETCQSRRETSVKACGQDVHKTSFLSLPTEIIESVVEFLDGRSVTSVRQTCRRLCETSYRTFTRCLAQNQYFALPQSLDKLANISKHESFREHVEALCFHPHSLVWPSAMPPPGCGKAGSIGCHSEIFKYPAEGPENEAYRFMMRCKLRHQRWLLPRLVDVFRRLPNLTKIEIGSWGRTSQDISSSSILMQRFEELTGFGLLHFDWQMPYKVEAVGYRAQSRASRDGTLSLTDDFNLILSVLSETRKPIVEFKAGYLSDLGLKCIQIQDVALPQAPRSPKASFLHLKVLHLALGFERGRRNLRNEAEYLTQRRTWLSDFLNLTPNVEDLTLVFDGYDVRENPNDPDWSGSIFYHTLSKSSRLSHLRKLNLHNMYVRYKDVAHFLDRHKNTLLEVTFNCMTMWTPKETQGEANITTAAWPTAFKDKLRSMPLLQSINIARLRINKSTVSFFPEEIHHCQGCQDRYRAHY